jgi:hypothetical protein
MIEVIILYQIMSEIKEQNIISNNMLKTNSNGDLLDDGCNNLISNNITD